MKWNLLERNELDDIFYIVIEKYNELVKSKKNEIKEKINTNIEGTRISIIFKNIKGNSDFEGYYFTANILFPWPKKFKYQFLEITIKNGKYFIDNRFKNVATGEDIKYLENKYKINL